MDIQHNSFILIAHTIYKLGDPARQHILIRKVCMSCHNTDDIGKLSADVTSFSSRNMSILGNAFSVIYLFSVPSR